MECEYECNLTLRGCFYMTPQKYEVILLIKACLEQILFYVDIDGSVSQICTSNTGTVQCSILGPIHYAIFVSQIFDKEKMSNYADDNYVMKWNSKIDVLITDMKKSL